MAGIPSASQLRLRPRSGAGAGAGAENSAPEKLGAGAGAILASSGLARSRSWSCRSGLQAYPELELELGAPAPELAPELFTHLIQILSLYFLQIDFELRHDK